MSTSGKILFLIALASLFPVQALAVDNVSKTATMAMPSSADKHLQRKEPGKTPVYRPPMRGAPAGRVGGGTRGATERESFALLVLTPEHIGYTSKEQPCLYWFISKPARHPVEMTITERKAVEPLFTQVIDGPVKGGIQDFCLADYEIHLQPDVPYKWFVTLVTDKNDRSKDILAGGMIERVEPPKSLQDKLMSKDSGSSYFVYAEEGYWFDSLESITKDIDRLPDNKKLIMQRAALLRQVGLMEAADIETVRQ